MIDWLEWVLAEDEALELEGEGAPGQDRPTVRAAGPDSPPGMGAERAGEDLVGEAVLGRGRPSARAAGPDGSPFRGTGEVGEDLASVGLSGEAVLGRDRALGPDRSPGRGAGRTGEDPASAVLTGEALPGWGSPSVRDREDRTRGGESLLERGRRARAAVEYAAGRREPVAAPVPVPAAGGGKALGAGELDRVFQRDARRYDGGFTLY